MNILCIPTYNAGEMAGKLIDALESQSARPEKIIVVDSSSTDNTPALFQKSGASVVVIPKERFDHGATRQMCVEMSPEADIILFLTQDAIPAHPDSIRNLLKAFDDKKVGAAYGRQLPSPGASPMAAHARLFNYPPESRIKTSDDAPELGIKTAYLSNSFAAYRRTALMSVGGFPGNTILGEDTFVAARMLVSGWKIAYCGDATVFHSHNYTPMEEFRRYFDTGFFYGKEKWIQDKFGRAEGEGMKFTVSEWRYLFWRSPLSIPQSILRNILKFIGFRLGFSGKGLPCKCKRFLSMNKEYWKYEAPAKKNTGIVSERGNRLLRIMDWYIGIPLLFLLGMVKPKRGLTPDISTIGLLKSVAIGDTVLMTAVIADLRAAYPAARLVLFAGESNYGFAKTIGQLDEVVKISVSRPWDAIRAIRAKRCDLFLDFGQWPRHDALLAAFSGSRCTVGYNTPGQFRHYAYDSTVPHSASVHELENYRGILRPLGIAVGNRPRITLDGNAPDLSSYQPYVIFHPWPGGIKSHLKEWPCKRWVELAEVMAAKGMRVLITGAPGDRERSEGIAAMARCGKDMVMSVAGRFTLAETFHLLKGASAVVSVNTGLMHIAAALDAPLAALHGPTSPLRWGPVSERAVVVQPAMGECGYLNLGFEYPANPPDCMGEISLERVLEVVETLLGPGPR